MASEDVRVRLSAEGTQEVVNAFKKIDRESKTAGKGISGLSSALGGLSGTLGALGIGVTVGGIVALAKASLDAADSAGDLASATGMTTENLSVYAVAAREAGVAQDGLEKGIVKFNRALADLQRGEKGATESFAQLGLSAADFVGLSPDQALNKFAAALGTVEGSAGKVDVAQQILGKSGADLIEVFDNLANEGFDNVRSRAEEAGQVISGDFAASAGEAKRALGEFEGQLAATTNAFLSGFLPTLLSGNDDINSSNADTLAGVRTFGQVFGATITTVSNIFTGLVKGVVAGAVEIGIGLETIGKVTKEALTGNFDAAAREWREGVAQITAVDNQLYKDLGQLGAETVAAWDTVGNAPAAGTTKAAETAAKQTRKLVDSTADAAKKAADDRRAVLNQQVGNELKALSDRYKAGADLEKQAYDAGKTSLEEYVTARRRLIEAAAAGEQALLAKKLAAAGDDKERAAIQGEIDARARQRQEELVQLSQDQAGEERRLADERLGFEQQILEAQGKRHEVAKQQLEAEAKQYAEVLRRQGVGAEEAAARVSKFQQAGQANIDFDAAKEKAQLAQQQLDSARQVATGDAEALRIERERLPVLRELAANMMAAAQATGDPAKIAEAQQFSAAIEAMGQKAAAAGNDMLKLREAAFNSLVDGLSNFLTNGIKEADSFEDAVKGMAAGVVDSMAQILAQMIAMQAMKSIFGGLGLPIPGFSEGGAVPGFADGGYTGPGGKYKPAGIVHAGEFVVRAAVVRQPGVMSMLAQLNGGGLPAITRNRPRGYAEGGLVTPAAGGGTMNGALEIGLADGLVARELRKPETMRVLIKGLSENKRAARGALGG